MLLYSNSSTTFNAGNPNDCTESGEVDSKSKVVGLNSAKYSVTVLSGPCQAPTKSSTPSELKSTVKRSTFVLVEAPEIPHGASIMMLLISDNPSVEISPGESNTLTVAVSDPPFSVIISEF